MSIAKVLREGAGPQPRDCGVRSPVHEPEAAVPWLSARGGSAHDTCDTPETPEVARRWLLLSTRPSAAEVTTTVSAAIIKCA